MKGTLKKLLERDDVSFAVSYLKGFEKGETELEDGEIIQALKHKNQQIRYWAVKAILKRFQKEKVEEFIDKAFRVKLKSEPVEFPFPVVSENRGEIAKGIAFLTEERQGGKVAVVEDILNSGVLVFFDREFSGDSFQAPLTYALIYGELPPNILLSGKLHGYDFSADHREEKEKIAEIESKILVSEGNIKELGEFFKQKEVQIPFFLAVGGVKAAKPSFDFFCNLLGSKPVKGFLSEKELIFPLPSPLPYSERWTNYFKQLKEHIESLKKKLYIPFSLHLVFFKTPSAFSFGAGIVIGAGKLPLALYHYESGNYYKVIDLTKTSRKIKERKKEPKLVEVKSFSEGRETAVVALQAASHEIEGKGREISEILNSDYYYVSLSQVKGNIPLEIDWAEVVAEFYEVMNQIYSKGYKKIHLIMSVPNPIACGLGMAIGNYWDIEVWSFFREIQDYKPVFNGRELPNI